MSKNKYTPKSLSTLSSVVSTTVDEAVQDAMEETAVDALQAPEDAVGTTVAESEENVTESVLEASVTIAAPAMVTPSVVEIKSTPTPPISIVIEEKGKLDMNVQHQLEVYAENMAIGKPIIPKEGGMHQYGLFKLIKTILDTEDQAEFTTKWNTLLNFVKNNKTKVFSESYVYRFPDQWPGSDNEFTNFRRIIMVIIVTCDNTTRSANLKTLSMEKALEGFTEKQKNRVIVYYGM